MASPEGQHDKVIISMSFVIVFQQSLRYSSKTMTRISPHIAYTLSLSLSSSQVACNNSISLVEVRRSHTEWSECFFSCNRPVFLTLSSHLLEHLCQGCFISQAISGLQDFEWHFQVLTALVDFWIFCKNLTDDRIYSKISCNFLKADNGFLSLVTYHSTNNHDSSRYT